MKFVIVAKATYVIYDSETVEEIDRVEILQNDDEIDIENDGVDDDGRREDEVEDQTKHFGGFLHLVLALWDERAADLWRNEEPDELIDMFVYVFGLVYAEDI